MPQFDPATWIPQFFWLLLVFAILYFGIVRLTLPKVGNVVSARENMVQADLAAAHHAKAEADGTRALYESEMTKARHDAQQTIQGARAAAAGELEEQLRATDASLDARLHAALGRIEAGRRDAEADIRRVAADAAADIVQTLTGTRPEESMAAAAVSAARSA